jgi:hypothetical protein
MKWQHSGIPSDALSHMSGNATNQAPTLEQTQALIRS